MKRLYAGIALAFALLWPSLAAAQDPDLCGFWQGLQSGNQVTISIRGDILEVTAVTHNPGQTGGTVFQRLAPGVYSHTFPTGLQAVVEATSSDRLRVTNPDGWTDVFVRISGCEVASDDGWQEDAKQPSTGKPGASH